MERESGGGSGRGPDSRSGNPTSPGGSSEPGSNRPGGPPPSTAKGAVAPVNDAERWGDLPVHVRDIFRSQGGTDLPPRYRDWIDAYHRRLNERR